jgi:hypothetical protein
VFSYERTFGLLGKNLGFFGAAGPTGLNHPGTGDGMVNRNRQAVRNFAPTAKKSGVWHVLIQTGILLEDLRGIHVIGFQRLAE